MDKRFRPINQVNTGNDENVSHEENSIGTDGSTIIILNNEILLYILADEQGKGLREDLRNLIDQEYNVFSFWKRGADH